jgi:hypothetical protein
VSDTTGDGETIDPKAPPPILVLQIEPAIEFQGGKYATLTMKEPTIGQKRTALEQLRAGYSLAADALYEIHLVSLISGVPIAVIERLPTSLFNRALAHAAYFLGVGR